MATIPTGGANLNAIPAPKKQTLATNYLSFTGGDNYWSQQFLPDLYEAEVERYGDRTVSSFLRMVGAEMPMTSDQVVWSQQGRLHLSYEGVAVSGDDITIAGHAIRKNQTLVIAEGSTTVKALVISVIGDVVTAKPYTAATLTAAGITGSSAVNVFVFGSEFGKATNGMAGAVTPSFQTFTNSPIIIKDKYEVSGSDASQIGWVEITGESGASGYLWYLKAEGDTRVRFEDYLEMTVVEGELAAAGSGALAAGAKGTEGLFAAIQDR